MSNTINTANSSVSSSNINITKDFIFSVIEFQLDNNDIGINIVVKRTKYIDMPSTPK